MAKLKKVKPLTSGVYVFIPHKIAKCEQCGKEESFPAKSYPQGWIQTGNSKYGKLFQRSGIAWLCPEHSNPTAFKSRQKGLL